MDGIYEKNRSTSSIAMASNALDHYTLVQMRWRGGREEGFQTFIE
jgi:hypothetical protein